MSSKRLLKGMPKYLIDANLPYYFSLWSGNDFIHVFDLNDEWSDSEIWEYAKGQNLTIVTKDVDFSDRMLMSDPPPKVIYLYSKTIAWPD